jgi:hypothetical protein
VNGSELEAAAVVFPVVSELGERDCVLLETLQSP